MAGTIWIPGAERLKPSAAGGTITSTAPPRVVWHTTEADPGTASVWAAMIRVLKGKNAEPQVLYDPVTDRLGQFMPLNASGRALRNDGGTMTNRVGRVCIQIEVIGRSAKPFTAYWKPGPNFRALMAAVRSWDIKDSWPAGRPPVFVASPPHNVPENARSRSIWASKGGHYGHSQIPGNDHGDPGGIDIVKLFAAGGTGTPAPPSKEELTVGQYEDLRDLIQEEGRATRKEVRRQAIGIKLYGVQTADEDTRNAQVFEDAYEAVKAAGGSEDAALDAGQVAVVQANQPLVEDLKSGAAKNEAGA